MPTALLILLRIQKMYKVSIRNTLKGHHNHMTLTWEILLQQGLPYKD